MRACNPIAIPSMAGDSRVYVDLVPDPLTDVLRLMKHFLSAYTLMPISRPQPKGHSRRLGPVVEGEG